MSKTRFTQFNWCCWGIVSLCFAPTPSAGEGIKDGLGKPDAQPNRVSGQVIQTNGQPAVRATIHVRGHEQSGIDAHITTDNQANRAIFIRNAM